MSVEWCDGCGQEPQAEGNSDGYCLRCETRRELLDYGERAGVSLALSHIVQLARSTHSGEEIRSMVETFLKQQRDDDHEAQYFNEAEAWGLTRREAPEYFKRLRERADERADTAGSGAS